MRPLELWVSWMIEKVIRWIDAILMHLNDRQLTLVPHQLAVTVIPSILMYYINAILTDSVNGIPILPRWCKPWHCPLDIEILVRWNYRLRVVLLREWPIKGNSTVFSPRRWGGFALSKEAGGVSQAFHNDPWAIILEKMEWKVLCFYKI